VIKQSSRKGVLQFGIRAIKQSSSKGVLQFGIIAIKQSSSKGVLQFGIKAKVLILILDGPVERSLEQECERKIGSGRPISDPGLLQNVKELLDEF
jgi:hypothetical protein